MSAALVYAAGCVDMEPGEKESPATATTEQPVYSDVGGIGPHNGVEWQIDAPWRLEPSGSPATYDAIPIVITVGDASVQPDDHRVPDDVLRLGRFCGMWVIEQGDNGFFSISDHISPLDFHEIEGQRQWLDTGWVSGGPGEPHQLARIWNDESPDSVLNVGDWAEWNAVALYTPTRHYGPGDDAKLIAFARISKTGVCNPIAPAMSPQALLEQLDQGRLSEDPWTRGSYFLSEPLRVHFGEEPLPRFGSGWSYGDLHYHSQGTDNEGEMGISYRGTIQAMKAMGLDFLFATEHASDSEQLTNAERFVIDDLRGVLPELPLDLDSTIEDAIVDFLDRAGIKGAAADFALLRDMNARRFEHLHGWLHHATGVNAQVSSSGGADRTPQIFLGGEVDAVPELSVEDARDLGFAYGFDQEYWVHEPCYGLIPEIIAHTDYEQVCIGNMLAPTPDLDEDEVVDSYAIRDVQGPLGYDNARQHMVYLPKHGADPDAFVSSDTGEFGGGRRYLSEIIETDLRDADKGYVFLAHPVAAESGHDPGRLGPDIVPYSDYQLQTAFASPEVLGLQLWNEDTRNLTRSGDLTFPLLEKMSAGLDRHINWSFRNPDAGSLFNSLAQGSAMWDRLLLWGITPSRLEAIGRTADQPRKMYMAGGSDAHGDLNYRREGRFFGYAKANDTAIGKPRNLVFVGENDGRPSQEQVVAALASGQFSVTDGPAVRVAIDVNGNNVIDEGDVPMGGDFTLPGTTAPVLVQWSSTSEFGRVLKVRLYVGGQSGNAEGVVWSAVGPGPNGAACIDADFPIYDSTGREYCPMKASYARDLTGTLEFAVPPNQGYAGTRRFDINPAQFPVFRTNCFAVDSPDGEGGTVEKTKCEVLDVTPPTRLYVRAFAETNYGSPLEHRFAFTNPIWMRAPNLPPVAPQAALTHVSCDTISRTNTFRLAVTPAAGTGITVNKQFDATGAWQNLSGTTFTALENRSVRGRAQACNASGCSGWVTKQLFSPACHEEPPATPRVSVEYTGCRQGTNSFLVTVTSGGGGPVTTREREFRIGTSGTWQPLTTSTINASSNQNVYVRARWCGPGGCSAHGTDWADGPTCGGGGGGNPRPPQ